MTASKCNATFEKLFASLSHGNFKSQRASTSFLLDLTFYHKRVLMLKRVVWKCQRQLLRGGDIFF